MPARMTDAQYAQYARLTSGARPRQPKAKRALRLQSEAELMRVVLAWLTHNKVFHVRLNSGSGMRTWGGKMRPVKSAVAGTPDLFVAGNGVTLFVELKAAGGRLRPSQRAWIAGAERAGLAVVVVRSLEQLTAALREEGVTV